MHYPPSDDSGCCWHPRGRGCCGHSAALFSPVEPCYEMSGKLDLKIELTTVSMCENPSGSFQGAITTLPFPSSSAFAEAAPLSEEGGHSNYPDLCIRPSLLFTCRSCYQQSCTVNFATWKGLADACKLQAPPSRLQTIPQLLFDLSSQTVGGLWVSTLNPINPRLPASGHFT
eukprot:3077670-Amphidinium_carterae.1